ncbi:hypothetical protein RSOLAG22IIIB_10608 [Rhizoctonia solani]|uniref:Transmembrane protein n=1 Tax=Rhizoctonia solani TaxID=456999 RepID=A0A0K6G3R1_9AGAM|nr:hypothetical protein RSOLAG22IIIB_10608 [Rhizoctonia solani]
MSTFPVAQQPDFCTTIIANPDISGRGFLSTVLLRTRNIEAFGEGCRNTLITSTGLTISAIITWKTNGISLFDGLIVTMLTSLMTSWILANLIHLQHLGFTINFSNFLYATFTTYWGLQVWQDPLNFGLPLNGENCTASHNTIIVVLGMNISSTNRSLRAFALFYFGLGILSALGSLVLSLIWLFHYSKNGLADLRDIDSIHSIDSDHSRGPLILGKILAVLPSLGGIIYMMVTIEQMVQRNNVESQLSSWTYGQTLSMLMLLQQILTCFSLIRREYQVR